MAVGIWVTPPEGEPIRTHATSSLTLPVTRALSRGAGALLAASTLGSAAIIALVLTANARAASLFPHVAGLLRIAAVLALLQIASAILIWWVYTQARARFAERLQAATGSLEDQVFLAGADGTLAAVLGRNGWLPKPAGEWFDSIHPEDRARWPIPSATEPQRIELRLKQGDGNWRWHRLRATPLLDDGGSVLEWVGTLHDIHEQRMASEHRELVIGELRHRLKNLLTVIDALAKNSRKPDAEEPGVEKFLQRFLGRLHALGAAGDIFLAGGREAVNVAALFEITLAPFTSETAQRVHVAGPPIFLSEETAAGFGLAVHELATNALKYGALSVPEGSVSLTWSTTREADEDRIVFEWKERGGPRPIAPAKPGFGTRMIKHVAAREKNGRVDIAYPEDGLMCRIAFVRENKAG